MTDWIAMHLDLRREVAAHERRIEREMRAQYLAVMDEIRASGHEMTPAVVAAIEKYLALGEAKISEGIETAAAMVADRTIVR